MPPLPPPPSPASYASDNAFQGYNLLVDVEGYIYLYGF